MSNENGIRAAEIIGRVATVSGYVMLAAFLAMFVAGIVIGH